MLSLKQIVILAETKRMDEYEVTQGLMYHRAMLEAYLEGCPIEYYDEEEQEWVYTDTPAFIFDMKYRVKQVHSSIWDYLPSHIEYIARTQGGTWIAYRDKPKPMGSHYQMWAGKVDHVVDLKGMIIPELEGLKVNLLQRPRWK